MKNANNLEHFMNAERLEQVLEKVGPSIKTNGKSTKELIETLIVSINNIKTTNIWDFHDEISSSVAFELPENNIDEETFETSYQHWKLNPIDSAQIQRVIDAVCGMKKEYTDLNTNFSSQLKEANEISTRIENDFKSVNGLCSKLLSPTNNPMKGVYCDIPDIVKGLEAIHTEYSKLLEKIENISKIIRNYNIKRFVWAEFMIGMRKTLDSEPKFVELRYLGAAKKLAKSIVCVHTKKHVHTK